MKTIAWGSGLILVVSLMVFLAIIAVSVLSFVLITALKIGLFAVGVFLMVTVGKKLFSKA